MKTTKDILIYLLFVVFSFLLWCIHAAGKGSFGNEVDESASEVVQDPVTEKRVAVPIEVTGVPEGLQVRTFPSVVEVYVRVKLSDYESIRSENLRIWTSYPTKDTKSLVLHADVDDERIQDIRMTPSEVEYLVETK